MKYPEYRFVELAVGGVHQRNNVVEITELSALVKKNPYECYSSLFRFTEDFRQYVEREKTVAGFAGRTFADYLPFDIDAEKAGTEASLARALEQARQLVRALSDEFALDKADFSYYFSGRRGFHILVPSGCFGCEPSEDISFVFKKLASMISETAKVSVDEGIYQLVKLFRIENTRHKGTGLYKIPLSYEEFDTLKVKEIGSLAKVPRQVDRSIQEADGTLSDFLQEKYLQFLVEVREPKRYAIETRPSQGVPPKSKLCYYDIMRGVSVGERDDCALRLTIYFKGLGYPSNLTLGALRGWNERNEPPLEADTIKKKIRQAYSNDYHYGCSDPVLRIRCNSKCYLSKKKEESIGDIKSIEQLMEDYRHYVNELKQRQIHLGLGKVDKVMRGVAPGEVCEIIGLPTVGKTALVINILRNVSREQKVACLFFSLEQPSIQVFERAASISTEMTGVEVEEQAKTGKLENHLSRILEDFGNVYVCDRDGLTLNEMKDYIPMLESEIEKKVRLVVIDYLGLVGGVFGSSYEVTTSLSRQIKGFAKQLGIAVCFVHHVSIKKKRVTDSIELGDARDSSVAVDAVDFLLGISRPDKRHIKVNLLKSRKSPRAVGTLVFLPEKMIIRPEEKT